MTSFVRQLALGLFGASFFAATMSACGTNFSPFCDEWTDCVDGNDADRDACIVQGETEKERADLYGCGEEFDAQFECIEDEASCENGVYGISGNDCEDESRDYGNCMSD